MLGRKPFAKNSSRRRVGITHPLIGCQEVFEVSGPTDGDMLKLVAVDRLLREVQTGAKVPVRTVDCTRASQHRSRASAKTSKIASSQAAVRTIGNKAGTVQGWSGFATSSARETLRQKCCVM